MTGGLQEGANQLQKACDQLQEGANQLGKECDQLEERELTS